MAKISKESAKKLLAVTIVAIVSFALGCLTHSELIHFFSEILGFR